MAPAGGRAPAMAGRIGVPRVKSHAAVASLTAAVAPKVLRAVLDTGKRLEPALADALADRPEVSWSHRRLLTRGLSALLRWWGWIEPLRMVQVEEQLALAWALDFAELQGNARVWAEKFGRPISQLMAVGDAPNWTARAEGLKRWMAGKPVTADPWMLFPAWLRDQLPIPPGDVPAKARRLAFLHALQTHWPLWVGVRGGTEKAVWNEFRDAGMKPWVHRRLLTAARLDADTDLRGLRAYQEGKLVIEDLASQALAKACDPDPGDRWWDVNGGAGLHALHLAALMNGKGTVVTTFEQEPRRRATAQRLRRFSWRNIAAKIWDGRHAVGKPGSFDGVLVDAPCSEVGAWRRHPEVRWTIKKEDLPRLAESQRKLLDMAATAVRPGGALVYSVATATVIETLDVVAAFLKSQPGFRLEPFPHPLEEASTTGTLQFWPHLYDCEARFVARFVRTTAQA